MMKKTIILCLIALLGLSSCHDEPNPNAFSIETITVNGVSFNMVKVAGGSLTLNMELPYAEHIIYQDSTLDVTIADFSIGQTEVTQALWFAVMGENHSYFSSRKTDYLYPDDEIFDDNLNRPVEFVSWYECEDFISKLNELTGRHFRFPTEAEWEFAARGGNKTHGYTYAGSNKINAVAWYLVNTTDGTTYPVGQKSPNELGIYDMSGNVWEWCSDYVSFYWQFRSVRMHIARGGGGASKSEHCTVGYRGYGILGARTNFLGLRLAE